jgi:hypothetical protein
MSAKKRFRVKTIAAVVGGGFALERSSKNYRLCVWLQNNLYIRCNPTSRNQFALAPATTVSCR